MGLFDVEEIEDKISYCSYSKLGVKIKLTNGKKFNLAAGFILNKTSVQGWDQLTQKDTQEIPLNMIKEVNID